MTKDQSRRDRRRADQPGRAPAEPPRHARALRGRRACRPVGEGARASRASATASRPSRPPTSCSRKTLDAVVIGTPDATHADLAIAALDRGLHVFCEKPLCYAVEDADRVIAARDRAGRVMQVGYMKRFDPSWQALRDMVQGRGERLRMITVEVNDPGSWPFTDHHDFLPGDDVPKAQIDEVATRRAEQTARAIGRPLTPLELKGFTGPLCSSSVHDVNARARPARRDGARDRRDRGRGGLCRRGRRAGADPADAGRPRSGRSSTSRCRSSPTISRRSRSSSTTASTSCASPRPI